MFKNLMSPEEQERFEKHRKRVLKRMLAAQTLSDKDYADELEYCMINSETLQKRHHRELTTYDDALALIHVPEILRRLRGKEERNNTSSSLVLRIMDRKEREQQLQSDEC